MRAYVQKICGKKLGGNKPQTLRASVGLGHITNMKRKSVGKDMVFLREKQDPLTKA